MSKALSDTRPDLDCSEHITQFVHAFYARVLVDEQLAPFFLDVAAIDLSIHLPLICSYWEKLLLGDSTYTRHTMNIHRALNARRPLKKLDFDRWLTLFTESADSDFRGEKTERAKQLAHTIAVNMQQALSTP